MENASEIEELAKAIETYELWHRKNLGVSAIALGYAEHLIKQGYRKHSPESSGLVPLNEEEVFSVVEANNNTFVRDADNRFIAKFICKKFGTQQSKLAPLSDAIEISNQMKEWAKIPSLNLTSSSVRLINTWADCIAKLGSPSVPIELRELIEEFPEINTNNYNHDDVIALNFWGIQVYSAIHRLLTNGKEGK